MALFKRKKKEEKPQILKIENIRVNQKADSSDSAIVSIGTVLRNAGYIEEPYIQGMLNRDHSLTTYIETISPFPMANMKSKIMSKKTGLAVDIYPEGIAWGGGTVRIVIGIAATTDEHVAILQNIAEKLGDMDVVEQVVQGDPDLIYRVLTGEAA